MKLSKALLIALLASAAATSTAFAQTNIGVAGSVVNSVRSTIGTTTKDMKVGDVIHADQIKLPDGVRLVSQPDILVVTCHVIIATKTTEEVEEETPTAPEVIGEAKESEETEEEEK